MLPCHFSWSQGASLCHWKTWIPYWFKFKNLASTLQVDIKKLLCVFKREAVEFLVAKIFAVSHFALTAGSPSCHSNLTRDRKTVVTRLSEFCSLHFPMKNLMLKVSNVPALYLTSKNRQAMGGGGWGEQITSGRVRRRPGSIWQILVLNLWE